MDFDGDEKIVRRFGAPAQYCLTSNHDQIADRDDSAGRAKHMLKLMTIHDRYAGGLEE